jgi:small-conductance mechanosensitive channel
MKYNYMTILLLAVIATVTPLVYAQVDSTKATASAGAPVIFAGDTLFFVHARLGPFSPQDRASAIAARMTRLSNNPLARIDTLIISAGEVSTDILSGDAVIMTVTNRDAVAAGLTRPQAAKDYAQKILAALKKEAASTSLKSILLGMLFTLIATGVALFTLKLLNRVFPRLYAKLNAWRGTRIPSLKIQKLEVLSANRITDTLIGLAKAFRVAAVLVLLYFYLPLVFSFFPWTRGLATTLFGYIISPLKAVWLAFVSYLPNIFFIGVILFVTHYIIKFIRLIFTEIGKGTITFPGFYRDWAEPTYKIIRFLVIAFAIVVILPYLPGSGSDAFKGVSVFFGILFSLGSASSIANVVTGVVLTYMRAFDVGDRVKIADTIGDVVEKTLLATRIRTIKNVDITIPNAMVLGSHIINFSSSAQNRGLILHTGVTIGYDVPWKKVHELLIAAARATQNILPEPAPFVLQTSLNDFYVSYELNGYTDQPNIMARIYSELHQNIQDKFNEAGVEIMSPHYSAMRDGNQTTIPENYLPKSYTPPAFRIVPTGNIFPKPNDDAAADKA